MIGTKVFLWTLGEAIKVWRIEGEYDDRYVLHNCEGWRRSLKKDLLNSYDFLNNEISANSKKQIEKILKDFELRITSRYFESLYLMLGAIENE